MQAFRSEASGSYDQIRLNFDSRLPNQEMRIPETRTSLFEPGYSNPSPVRVTELISGG